MPRWITNLFLFIIVAGIPPLLVLSNVMVFMSPQYLDYEYSKPDFPPSQLFNPPDRRYYAIESILFERGERTFEQFKALGVYNDRELNHMVDVRVLVAESSAFLAMDALMLVVLLAALISTRATRPIAAQALFGGAVLTVALFAAIGLYAALFFDSFFYYFHILFFEGTSGFFNYTDSLIQFYPERFWDDTTIALVVVTILEAVVLGVIGWLWGRALARQTRSEVVPNGISAK